MPFELLEAWLAEEKQSGAPNPRQAVLSTVSSLSIPHCRVVAIREISEEDGLLFFTQQGTRKVEEIKNNPNATIIFWLEIHQRQIIVEGLIEKISDEENEIYWNTYPRESQIRFTAYAPTSGQVVLSKEMLEEKKNNIAVEYKNTSLPMSPYYCGYRLKPNRIVFYAYRIPELSDVFEYSYQNKVWRKQLMSP